MKRFLCFPIIEYQLYFYRKTHTFGFKPLTLPINEVIGSIEIYTVCNKNTSHILNHHLNGASELRKVVMVPPPS